MIQIKYYKSIHFVTNLKEKLINKTKNPYGSKEKTNETK